MTPEAVSDGLGSLDRFATTRWSVIVSSAVGEGGQRDQANAALEELCRIYWRPIFAFICRRGYQPNDAEDLTQDFFVNVLEGNLLNLADPARGRFRALLMEALRRFLKDASVARQAQKRGGWVKFVSWEHWMAEAPSQLSLPAHAVESWPPEKLYDLRWAATVIEQAMRRLREECESHGRRRLFDLMSAYLVADRAEVSYPSIAQKLGVAAPQVKKLIHGLRQRYRELLRDEVAHTVEKPADVDDEIRYLCGVLAVAE